jgi:broad specificity phosphatase PhoE
MKSLLLSLTLIFSSLASSHEVTLYLIRHAQAQDDGTKNPHLTELGNQQAQQWAKTFKDVDFDQIMSTDYFRTQETAAQTAKSKSLNVQSYDPNHFDINKLVTENNGAKILIVGHSNTTPDNINALLKEKKYEWIDHHDHGYLFIVKVYGDTISVEKLMIF